MTDHEEPNPHRVMINGEPFDLIPYGSETIDGTDIFDLPCRVCGAERGRLHARRCTLGAGHPHERLSECRDCAVPIGGHHSLGCGIEQCPRCGGQYVSCDCDSSEDATDEEEIDDADR